MLSFLTLKLVIFFCKILGTDSEAEGYCVCVCVTGPHSEGVLILGEKNLSMVMNLLPKFV